MLSQHSDDFLNLTLCALIMGSPIEDFLDHWRSTDPNSLGAFIDKLLNIGLIELHVPSFWFRNTISNSYGGLKQVRHIKFHRHFLQSID